MNKAATLTATAVTAGAVLLTTRSAAAPPPPPPTTIEVYVAEGAPTHVDELEPGIGRGDWLLFRDPVLNADGEEIGIADTRVQIIAAAGNDDLSFILDCTIELDRGRLVFSGAELFSHVESETTFAVIGGTGSYAGAEGDVTGTPSTVDGQPASHLTFHLSKK
jgi:hypothetical protein